MVRLMEKPVVIIHLPSYPLFQIGDLPGVL
jgi:hypothetical protein